jgi:hypothetical protein
MQKRLTKSLTYFDHLLQETGLSPGKTPHEEPTAPPLTEEQHSLITSFLSEELKEQNDIDYCQLMEELSRFQCQEVTDLQKRARKLRDDFESLEHPGYFYCAYPSILEEINRRLVFDTYLNKQLEPLNACIAAESLARKSFLKECS